MTLVCTPLLVERAALGRLPGTRVLRTGMGPRPALPEGPAILAGVAGSLSVDVRPGDVVVASEVRGAGRAIEVASAPLLAGALRRLGLRVHVGAIVSRPKPVDGAARQELATTGAIAVDMESAYLAPAAGPFAAVRTIVDTPDRPLWRPGTVWRGLGALRALRRTAPAVAQWVAAAHEREVLLAAARRQVVLSAQAARRVAAQSDVVLMLGSDNPPDSQRLVEIAEGEGVPAYVVDDAGEVDLAWLAGARRVGITPGASAPLHLVDDLVHTLTGLGPLTLRETQVVDEDIRFTLSQEVS